jgi:hypothetical protein
MITEVATEQPLRLSGHRVCAVRRGMAVISMLDGLEDIGVDPGVIVTGKAE